VLLVQQDHRVHLELQVLPDLLDRRDHLESLERLDLQDHKARQVLLEQPVLLVPKDHLG
jgi:hypothetical protein